jgi:hypothetical protein
VNDDEFESSDSIIIDLLIPANGTYFVEVDTFRRLPGDVGFDEATQLRADLEAKVADGTITPVEADFLDRLVDSLDDTDVGGIDIIIGGPGDSFDSTLEAEGVDGTAVEGTAFTRTISFVDRAASSWSGTVDFGDSTATVALVFDDSTGSPSFDLSHVYADNGTYTVTATVTNDIGTTIVQTFDVVVDNLLPTPVIESVSPIRESGTAIDVVGSATDAGANDVLTFTYEVFVDGDTTPAFTGTGVDLTTFSFTPTSTGSFEVVLTVIDQCHFRRD